MSTKEIKYYAILCDSCGGLIKEVKVYYDTVRLDAPALCESCLIKSQFADDLVLIP